MPSDKELDLFASKIKDLRRKCNLSQEELAFRLDIDQSGLSKIERGVRKLRNIDLYGKIKSVLK